jgi:hypothetical protein
MNIPDELHHIGFVIANDDEEFLGQVVQALEGSAPRMIAQP